MGYGKLVGAAAAALVVVALAGCDTMDALLDDKPGNAFGQTEAVAPQEQDVAFAAEAAMAGSTEVLLGQLALEKSNIAAVKTFAQEMVTDHGAANAELTALAEAREIDLPTPPTQAQAAADAGLAALEGTAFEQAYADKMVKDHEAAVALFEAEAANGGDAALKAFAQETLPTLRTHLEHARALQSSL